MLASDVVAVCIADVHLSLKPPVARSCEPDWLKAQARPIRQVKRIASQLDVPVICAGDLFDRPNPPPELINWAIKELPVMWAVPGQHDLLHHNYKDLKKTAFWTLCEAGRTVPLHPDKPRAYRELRLHGFPWGTPVGSWESEGSLYLDVAVIHAHIWNKKTRYAGAPENQRAKSYFPVLGGYDVSVWGDNHHGFTIKQGEPSKLGEIDQIGNGCLYNCGCLIRRKMDERELKPAVGLLHSSGKVTRHYLDVSKDKFLEPKDVAAALDGEGLEEFLAEMRNLSDSAISFADAVKRVIGAGDVPEPVRRLLLEAMEEK